MEELFRNPKTISGVTELFRKSKLQNKDITLKQVKEFLRNKYTAQIHKPLPSRNIKYYPITASAENDLIQIDLMDVSNISTKNNNYKYLMVCVDVYSRKGYIIPLKNKNTKSITEAFIKFLTQCIPKKITCDNGSEFISKDFTNICKRNNIQIDYVNINNHLIPHVVNRLGIVDRWIQTFRSKMEKYMTEHDTNNYIKVLDDLVENMNSSFNSGIKSTPNNPDKMAVDQITTQKVIDAFIANRKKSLKINDNVRCALNKNMFEK